MSDEIKVGDLVFVDYKKQYYAIVIKINHNDYCTVKKILGGDLENTRNYTGRYSKYYLTKVDEKYISKKIAALIRLKSSIPSFVEPQLEPSNRWEEIIE